ncbi:MAG: trypsin-like serine protease [Actinobacteria bacterium]|nr:MAG: trypsin-like serine protease [Actinomycetota bacterium]
MPLIFYDRGSAERAALSSSAFSARRCRAHAATVRSVRERPVSLAIVAIVAAVIGGISVLVVGKAAGWLTNGTKKTVVVQTPGVAQAVATPRAAVSSDAKPLVGNGFDPSRIYSTRAAGVVTIFAVYGGDSPSAQESQGSGFVVSPKGYILTNSHVITNAGEGASRVSAAGRLFVEFQDQDRVAAKVVGWDIYDDVGLIKVNPADHRLDAVPLGDSSQVKVGQPVAAIGSPFGNVNSLSVGVVSATERSIDSLTSQYSLVDAIQTDAAINHGNSGGPLFDARGRVIGINAQIRSDSGAAEGVGFAVPIDSARRSMTQLIAAGRVSYAYVGIETEDLIPSIATQLHYPVMHGAVVTRVNPHSPGARVGLRGGTDKLELLGSPFTRGGDVIVSIAGHPVWSAEDVVRVVTEELSPGQSVPIVFIRGGRRHRVNLRLVERPANPG